MDSNRATGRAHGIAFWATAIGATVVALALLLPSTAGKGPEMDEGAVVAYSARVLDGAVPHRDFLTFYGPGNLWLVAGAFEVFGTSIGTERAVGLLYRVIIVLSLFALARGLSGLIAGALAAVISATIMAKELVWAYPTYGSIAFGLVGIVLALSAVSATGRRQQLLLLGAGAAGGLALLTRFDLALAIVFSSLPLLARIPRARRLWYGGGLLALAGIYVPYAAIVGSVGAKRVLDDLIATGPGRDLPIPSLRAYPGSLLFIALLTTGLVMLLGIVLWQRRPPDLTGPTLLSIGLFNAGLLPWTLFRADVWHIRPFALVPLSLLPALVVMLAKAAGARQRTQMAVLGVVVGVSLVVLANQPALYVDRIRALPDLRDEYRGFYNDDNGGSAGAVVARARQLARPGDSLFVGPQDLRRTNYGPTYMYFLLPQLEPASYYMEMNPMTANREGSGLAAELGRADWLLLTSEWDNWDEPNESSKYGPSAPNEIVRNAFCLRFESGAYRLYERCRERDDPSA